MSDSRNHARVAVALQCLMLPLLIWFVWSVDIWMAFSLTYPEYPVFAAISCGLLLLPRAVVHKAMVVMVPSLWAAFLLALPFITNSSLKPLMWGVRDLEQGMGRETVLATINSHYADTRFPVPLVLAPEPQDTGLAPRSTRLCLKPQGRNPGFDAESLLVFLVGGRFDQAEFSAD